MCFPFFFLETLPARRVVLAACLCLTQALLGNPIAPRHQFYIAGEKLEVEMGRDGAEISGKFRFQSLETDKFVQDNITIEIEIPVWIPAVPWEGDDTVRQFLAAYDMSRPHYLDNIDPTAWDAAIGLRFRVGTQDIKPRSFRTYQAAELTPMWRREGFHCVLVTVLVQPKLLARRFLRGVPETVITYRQPMRKTADGKSEFFYVPTFHNLPQGSSTDNLRRYSMHVGGDVFPLKHGVPIVLMGSKD